MASLHEKYVRLNIYLNTYPCLLFIRSGQWVKSLFLTNNCIKGGFIGNNQPNIKDFPATVFSSVWLVPLILVYKKCGSRTTTTYLCGALVGHLLRFDKRFAFSLHMIGTFDRETYRDNYLHEKKLCLIILPTGRMTFLLFQNLTRNWNRQ